MNALNPWISGTLGFPVLITLVGKLKKLFLKTSIAFNKSVSLRLPLISKFKALANSWIDIFIRDSALALLIYLWPLSTLI